MNPLVLVAVTVIASVCAVFGLVVLTRWAWMRFDVGWKVRLIPRWMRRAKWEAFTADGGRTVHLVPVNDGFVHTLDRQDPCPCHPREEPCKRVAGGWGDAYFHHHRQEIRP